MHKGKIFLFGLALFIASTMNSCISYQAVQVKEIKSVAPVNNDLSSGKLLVNLRVVNPNSFPIKVKKYDLHAFVNNVDLGQVVAGKKIVIPKKSDQDHELTFAYNTSEILNLLPSLLLKGSADVGLKGNLKVKALFLSKSFPVDLKRKIRASDLK